MPGSGSGIAVLFFHRIGSGLDPKNVDAAVPATTPLLFTAFGILNGRVGDDVTTGGSDCVPPPCVQSSGGFTPDALEKPVT